MSEIKDLISILLMFIAILLFLVIYFHYIPRKVSEVFEQIAKEHGWCYEEQASEIPESILLADEEEEDSISRELGPGVSGICNSRKFALIRYREELLRTKRPIINNYTVISALHKGFSSNVSIQRKWIEKIFTTPEKDIVAVDPSFDNMFVTRSDYKNMHTLFDIGTRQKLLNLISRGRWRKWGLLEINQKDVIFTNSRIIITKDFLLGMIDIVTNVADNVDRYC